jgi:hypothetical protein
MLLSHKTLALIALIASVFLGPLNAQDDFDENSKINTNLGFPITLPANTTGDFTRFGTGVTAGAGYNFNSHNAFVGEFMWNWLYPTDASLTPLRDALQSTALNGHSNLFGLTANYKLEGRGRRFGGYVIGGGGLYYRNATLSASVTPPAGTACTTVWEWWGFTCSSGTVVVATHKSFSSAVFGGNFGGGFTIKVGSEPRYRMYFEARYHYIPDSTTPIRFIPVTTGIRF